MDIDLIRIQTTEEEYRSETEIMMLKRVQKEINRLFNPEIRSKNITRVNFNDPDDPTSPLLVELMPNPDTNLYSDFVKHNIPGIVVAIYFIKTNEESYPFIPPRLRVVRPQLTSGRTLSGGAICADMLYAGFWSPANNLAGLLDTVIQVLSETVGEGVSSRLDVSKIGTDYTFEDYLKTRKHIAEVHDWESKS